MSAGGRDEVDAKSQLLLVLLRPWCFLCVVFCRGLGSNIFYRYVMFLMCSFFACILVKRSML